MVKNMRDLAEVKRVRINDYSEYESGKSSNGGCYGFWTDYNRVEGGWEVSYGTTADFEFCPCCGSFDSHYGYDEEEYTCGEFEVISNEELEKIISSFESEHSEDDDYFIEYKEVEWLGIKKGTKLTSTPKDILYQIRVDEETDSKVKAVCEKEGISKSEVIRQGIELKYRNLEIANQ